MDVSGDAPRPAFIGLGSNIAPGSHLAPAVERLRTLGTLLAVSQLYRNPAVGPRPQPDFVNGAVLLRTRLDIAGLRAGLRAIEAALGRVRGADRFAPRCIDLDLCLLGDARVRGPGWRLPDPDIERRAHLAVCLAELAPDFVHPDSGRRLARIAAALWPGARLQPCPALRPAAWPPGPVRL